MTDRRNQPKSKQFVLHEKVDDYVRRKTASKDTQERYRTSGLLTTTNVPKKSQEARFEELGRTLKAQNHGSPTQSKFIRPLMSPPKLKGNPIDIPKPPVTILDDEMPTSPLQRTAGSSDIVRASPSSRKSASSFKSRTIESVSDRVEKPATIEEYELLNYSERQRVGGYQGIKKHIESLQQLDVSANGKKSRRDSSREDRYRTKERPSTAPRALICPPSSDSEEDDYPFKDLPVSSAKSAEHSKKSVSSGALISVGSAESSRSTEPSKHTGANRPLSRIVNEKPRLLAEKTIVKTATVGSRSRGTSEDYGSDYIQTRDRSMRKSIVTSAEAVKPTSLLIREEENLRRSMEFFVSIGSKEIARSKEITRPKEKTKDFFDLSTSQPPRLQGRSGDAKAALSSQPRAKDELQRRTMDRDTAARVKSSKQKDRSSTVDVVELFDNDSDPFTHSSPATKRTRAAQSSSDSETEKESKPKSRTKPDVRPITFSQPVQAHAVSPKNISGQFTLPSPSKKKDADERFTLPSPSKKKSCYESPSGYISNQMIYMLSDDDIPRKAIEDDNVCPYCGDPLPKKKSLRLTKALAKIHAEQKRQQERKQERKEQREHEFAPHSADLLILEFPSKSIPRPRPKRREKNAATGENFKEDSDSDSRRRRDSEHRDYDPFGSPPPSSSLSSPPKDKAKLSLMDRFEFCRVHIADEQIIPHGMENGYPMAIDFPGLDARVKMMEPELKGIVDGSVPSPFLEKALSNYKRMGVIGARNPHFVLASVQQTLPGYYGSKGSSELFKILARLFLESQFLTHEKANPQKPSEYIQHVLVPEAGVRLIAEDRKKSSSGNPISLEVAREIMMESVEFGSYVHDIELYP